MELTFWFLTQKFVRVFALGCITLLLHVASNILQLCRIFFTVDLLTYHIDSFLNHDSFMKQEVFYS